MNRIDRALLMSAIVLLLAVTVVGNAPMPMQPVQQAGLLTPAPPTLNSGTVASVTVIPSGGLSGATVATVTIKNVTGG